MAPRGRFQELFHNSLNLVRCSAPSPLHQKSRGSRRALRGTGPWMRHSPRWAIKHFLRVTFWSAEYVRAESQTGTRSKSSYNTAITLLSIYPSKMKTLSPQKDLCKNVPWNFIHHRQKLATTQTPINRRMDNQIVSSQDNGTLLSVNWSQTSLEINLTQKSSHWTSRLYDGAEKEKTIHGEKNGRTKTFSKWMVGTNWRELTRTVTLFVARIAEVWVAHMEAFIKIHKYCSNN